MIINVLAGIRSVARRTVPGFLLNYARHLFGRFAAFYFYDGHKKWHYSQEGEDVILARMFEHQSPGFYVDIGAHHPRRFSNTRLLAEKGWTGINVDPLPGVMKLFGKIVRLT